MIDIPPAQVKAFQGALLTFFHEQHPDIMKDIDRKGRMEDETKDEILHITDEFKASWNKKDEGGDKTTEAKPGVTQAKQDT